MIVILIISLILDGLLTNYLPYLVNDLSLFTPLLTVVTIFIIYPGFRKRERKYFITIFIVGLVYDLLYTNLLFFNALIFLVIAYLSKIIYKNYEVDCFKLIIYLIGIIISYEVLCASIFFIFDLVPITIDKLIYKITHSILLNIIYGEIIYFIMNKLLKNKKKISIN